MFETLGASDSLSQKDDDISRKLLVEGWAKSVSYPKKCDTWHFGCRGLPCFLSIKFFFCSEPVLLFIIKTELKVI